MVLHTHSQPSWMKAWIVQTIRGRKVNMSSGQGITSCHVGGNPICSLVQRFREHFRGVNYFSYLLVGCNCSRRGENVYSCGHALTAFHLCESLLNIYLCTSPPQLQQSPDTQKTSAQTPCWTASIDAIPYSPTLNFQLHSDYITNTMPPYQWSQVNLDKNRVIRSKAVVEQRNMIKQRRSITISEMNPF